MIYVAKLVKQEDSLFIVSTQDIDTQTEDLQSTSHHFRRGANQVRKRMWWKDLKWKIIIALTILVILGIIIGKDRWLSIYIFFGSVINHHDRLILGSIVGTQVSEG